MNLKIIFCLFFFTNTMAQEKFVIGLHNYAGFFSAFSGVLNNLYWCEKNNKIPVVYWGKSSMYYVPKGFHGATNVWEYYFEPVSNLKYKGESVHNSPWNLAGEYLNFLKPTLEERKIGRRLIDKYIKLKKRVADKVDVFYQKYMRNKKTIGIHLRGTDKPTETHLISPDVLIDAAIKYKGYQFLIATDEVKLLKIAQKKLKGKIIYYDCYRSYSGKPLHHLSPDKAQSGEDVLVEALLLSKCEKIIHTSSNVSIAVLYFNPDIESIYFYNQRTLLRKFRKMLEYNFQQIPRSLIMSSLNM